MKINNLFKWFTLVEMLIWVALSATLMISISIFVTNWIKNVTIQKKVLDNIEQNLDFFMETQSLIKRISGSWTIVWSWILFPIHTQYDNWAYAYLWIKSYSWTVCQSNEDNELELDEVITKHLFLKRFFPYEWSRISNWYYTSTWSHFVKDSSGNIVIWKEIFWDKLEDWDKWVDVYLNTPTWIASFWSKVFISDTLNNRILFYNASSWFENIFTILDSSDWILMPSWLAYDDTNKVLYISNSGKWEILKYSWWKSWDDLNIDFKIPQTINNVKKVQIDFMPWITSITEPNSKWDINFNSWLSKNSWIDKDYFETNNNSIEYYFSDFNNNILSNNIVWCSNDNTSYTTLLNDVTKEVISGCNASTWYLNKYTWNTYQDINTLLTDISINIPNISWSDFSNTGSYYINLKLLWDTSYEEYFPLFTVWDNKILTKDDNALSIIKSWFKYPTWLELNWSDLIVNDFIDRKKYKINLTNLVQTEDSYLWDYDYETIDERHDYLLEVPVEDINITNVDWILTIVVRYYKKYHCTNPDERALRTMIFKKNLK